MTTTLTQAERDAIIADERQKAEIRISERFAAAGRTPSAPPARDASHGSEIDELRDKIADAESRGEWGTSSRLKQQLTEALRPARPSANATADAARLAKIADLKARIVAAESTKDFVTAGRLKDEWLAALRG